MAEIHQLTGAYVLDAVDDTERKAFERHLRGCVTCSLEVAEFREAAAALAARAAQPAPPGLRERVLDEVARTRQAGRGRGSLPGVSWRRGLAVAAAAVVLVAGAGLGGVAWQSHRETAVAQAEASRVAQVLTDPGRAEVTGSTSLGGSATLVASGGTAVFAADRLPAPPDGRVYQLWLVHRSGVITSAGVLRLAGGSAQSVVSGITPGVRVTMSVEPSGGSKQPTTSAILALKVT